MAIPSSGTINISILQTEFGGANPVNLSEYYRGGGLVPDTPTNAGVPTSGPIKFSDFYGAAAGVPDDITPDGGFVIPDALDGLQTQVVVSDIMSGINVPITLRVVPDSNCTAEISTNGGAFTTGNSVVSNGQNVSVRITSLISGQNIGTVDLLNVTDGNSAIQVINYDLGLFT